MRPTIITAILLATILSLSAQTGIEQVLGEVERNNTRLRALQMQLEAQSLENRTGLYPPDPSAEYAYLWGSPSLIGNRVNIAVTQSFDFPTSYIYKSRIAAAGDRQLELEYQRQLMELRYEATLILLELIHKNALDKEYERRLQHARSLRNSYKTMLEQGETSLPSYNKAELSLLNIRKAAEMNAIERSRLLSDLATLNGGKEVTFTQAVYPQEDVPEDFEQWYSRAQQDNPVLQWLAGETAISRMQEKLSKALSLPSFHAGYMSEAIGAEQFSGIAAGITIPLWETRNTVSHARAQTEALQSIETDNRLRLYRQLESAHAKARALQESVAEYRLLLRQHDNTRLLEKALDMGEINLTAYILELTIYYSSTEKLMEAELDMHISIAELYRYN